MGDASRVDTAKTGTPAERRKVSLSIFNFNSGRDFKSHSEYNKDEIYYHLKVNGKQFIVIQETVIFGEPSGKSQQQARLFVYLIKIHPTGRASFTVAFIASFLPKFKYVGSFTFTCQEPDSH